MDFDLTQTDALLSTTRAVRKRLDFDREVPDDVLLDCLQLAVQAPTGSNRQGWRWLVVRDAEKKEALADIYRRVGGDYLAAAARDADTGSQTGRVLDSANFLAEKLGEVPVMVIPMIVGRLDDATHELGRWPVWFDHSRDVELSVGAPQPRPGQLLHPPCTLPPKQRPLSCWVSPIT